MNNENEIGRSEETNASIGKMISYSFGDIVAFYLSGAYTVFIFFFYEVEVGLSTVLVGLALVIFALWNAVNAPLVGFLTDKPFKWTKKWGMRTPWILIGVFPALLFYILIFLPPNVDVKTNPWPIFWYMVITLCVFNTCYTLFTVHFWGTFANQFRSDYERRKASVYDNIIPFMGAFLLTLIPPLFIIYGNKESYALAAIINMSIMVVFMFISIPGIRESEELKKIFIQGYENAEKISFFKTLKTLFRLKNFRINVLTLLLVATSLTLNSASTLYFFKDILGLPYSYAVLTITAYFVSVIISIPFWSWIAKKIGHAQTFTLGILLVSLSYIPYLWINTIEEAIIFTFIGGIGFGAFFYMILTVFADINDEVALELGKRQDATVSGIRTFFDRLGILFQAIIIVLVHINTGYNPDPNATQTPLAIWGIRIHMALIPFVFTLIAFFVMYKWFDLKGEKKEKIFAELKEKGLK